MGSQPLLPAPRAPLQDFKRARVIPWTIISKEHDNITKNVLRGRELLLGRVFHDLIKHAVINHFGVQGETPKGKLDPQ